jgi:predicted amidohydrolase
MPETKDTLNFAAIAMTSGPDKGRNIETAFALVRKAASQGADWVQLPEMWPFMGSYDDIYLAAEVEGGPLYQSLAQLAKSLGIVLIAGTVGERPDHDRLPSSVLINEQGQRRVFNTTYVFGRDGSCLAKYRKIHLFNLVGDDGTPRYMESAGYIAGDQPVAVTIDGWRLGLTICYDLRFPELFERLNQEGSPDVYAVPSAFTKMTGKAHWELLLRARAVERQCYIFAANQTGVHAPEKESFGHSMIVDPWGQVLDSTGTEPGIASGLVEKRVIRDVRAKLPALANRRPAVFSS